MRQTFTTAIELLGMAAISIGVGLIFVPAGLIVAGILLCAVGYLAGGNG